MEQSHNYTVYCNSLYIFESLVNEHKTGKWLYEDLISLTYKDKSYNIFYVPIDNKKQLLVELNKIKTEVKERLRLPIIHIEAHGDKEGFEIARTKEYLNWRELNNELAEINFLCRNNLILSLGVCNGHYINIDMMHFFGEGKRCPYIVNISPQDKISSHEIKHGFSSFYKSLFQKREFFKAMNSMQEITVLNFLSTADIFAKKMIEFLINFSTSKDFTTRTTSQLHEMIKKGNKPLQNENFNQNLKYLKKYKRDYFQMDLKKRWNYFLMIDVYEENQSKFEDFEKIWN